MRLYKPSKLSGSLLCDSGEVLNATSLLQTAADAMAASWVLALEVLLMRGEVLRPAALALKRTGAACVKNVTRPPAAVDDPERPTSGKSRPIHYAMLHLLYPTEVCLRGTRSHRSASRVSGGFLLWAMKRRSSIRRGSMPPHRLVLPTAQRWDGTRESLSWKSTVLPSCWK